MKKLLLPTIIIGVTMIACQVQQKENQKDMNNPFFKVYDTPFQVPPFGEIKLGHYLPAIEEGIKQHNEEIEAIVNNTEEPDFENTILAFDRSGELLSNVENVFFPLNSADTNDKMQELARVVSSKLTEHRDNISLNPGLFKKVKAVYEKRNIMGLDGQQIRVVEKFYQDFERNGANLTSDKQERLRELNSKLAKLNLQFGENLLAETNKNFRLVISNEKGLAGLPGDVVERASIQAKNDGMEGKWVFTLSKPSMIPFLRFAENRGLREKIYRGYFMRGDNGNENDNKEIVKKIVKYRDERAKLLGFNNHAEYVIDVNMAKTPEAVYELLHKLWKPALKKSIAERDEMQAIIGREGGGFKLRSWDWWYYAEKLRKEKYDLDEAEVKPYFSLGNAVNGIFYVANKLYGVTFEKRGDIPVYHKEVVAYEAKEADGSHIGVLYMDFYPRDGKRVGAWQTSFRTQSYKDGKMVHPVASIVMNFTRPAGDMPALLSFEEVTTLFHEFGHALHELFTDGPYRRTAGDVPRDFVEFPSQVMENWAAEPEVLKVYAKHFKTGEPIPDELINKLVESSHFNQGFETVEYVAASFLDMDYHTIDNPEIDDVRMFEKAAMDKIGLIDEILPRYRSTYFAHIFSGGDYSAGYYVYIWAAVLDTDAFNAFKDSGDIFNHEYAAKFRELLTRSGADEGMNVYLKFRGKKPSIEPLLEKRGLID